MKKILLSVALYMVVCCSVYAECEETGLVYVACKPGYYLDSGDCVECPWPDDFDGSLKTSVDENNGGINSCYFPGDTTTEDEYGKFVYENADCYYDGTAVEISSS